MTRAQTTCVVVVTAALLGGLASLVRNRPVRMPEQLADTRPAPLIGKAEGLGTTRQGLEGATAALREKIAADPADGASAVALAQLLLRRGRVEASHAFAVEAEHALDAVLKGNAGDYAALRMLATVYASEHRFPEAEQLAKRAIAIQPKDAWNYGVLGDSLVEQGQRDAGFDAFDTMVRLRPDAAAYARVAYAQELQGHLREALASMRMATEATSARDAESLAWHHAQVGNLLLRLGERAAAMREFKHADYLFPGHPDAAHGLSGQLALSALSAPVSSGYRN